MKAKKVTLYSVDDSILANDTVDVWSWEYRGDDITECETLLKFYMEASEDLEGFFGARELDILARNNWQVLKVGYFNDGKIFALLKYVYKNGNIKYRLIWFDGTIKQFLDRSGLINECEHDL